MNCKMKKWMETLVMCVLILLSLYCLIGVHEQEKSGELFFPFGFRPVVILTGSMEDTIQTGAVVLVRQTKEIEKEDVIFFFNDDGIPVVHRCIDVLDDASFVTKGDANKIADFVPVEREQVQGKVVCVMNWLAPVFG